MPLFLVERYVPGLGVGHVVQALARLRRREDGEPVRHLCSLFVPADETCFCLFEALSAVSVVEANGRAGLPFERVVEAVVVSAENLTDAPYE